jgi:hypothetical protein
VSGPGSSAVRVYGFAESSLGSSDLESPTSLCGADGRVLVGADGRVVVGGAAGEGDPPWPPDVEEGPVPDAA